jgi:hypothetical protein
MERKQDESEEKGLRTDSVWNALETTEANHANPIRYTPTPCESPDSLETAFSPILTLLGDIT